MDRDIDKRVEHALIAITLSTATLVTCMALLVLG
jgi:hypothetical protein